ncbi:protein FAM107B isoform X1 [Octodon degus]|uniref:Protein FAM107B isoform X1 n=2 Tax=Octodon degus TaxID=10160 RepID=A0A6P3FP97_OCTDE|nr:protein FAM107B isoform X1 [Octodon degus]
MSTWKARLTQRLKAPSGRMHPFPCSALLDCFGSTREPAPFDQPSAAEAHATIYAQPKVRESGRAEAAVKRRESGTSAKRNGPAKRNSINHPAVQPAEAPEGGPGTLEDEPALQAVTLQMSIPRPSIIDRPEEEEFQEESKCPKVEQKTPADSLPENSDPKDSPLIPGHTMAEPDYVDADNPELIRPQKLVNPVKTSRNHQDLHRELLMNQKRGLAPQNKPELQKVMEKRKRDQVIKQKEEEAQKKKSDLEIELLKRQQKLEQLELEKQKLQEEQENAPEFVKVKGNLRRTGQEVPQAQES